MSDAVLEMSRDRNDAVIIGMPDVYIHNSENNFYKDMLESDGDIVLATWDYKYKTMKGKVGQVLVDRFSNVLQVIDKDPTCEFDQMWGAILFRNGLERIESFNNLLRQANTIRMNQRLNRSLEPAPGFTNHLIDRRSGS